METQATGNVIYMGNLCEAPASPQAFMSQALEVQPHGSGFLLKHGANKHTPEETEGSVCGKRTVGELSSPGGGSKA